MTTFADFQPKAAGPRLLPAGIRNFTIVSAVPEINEWSGKRQIIFTFTSAEGGGVHELDLEAGQPQYQEVVDNILLGVMKNVGFQPADPNTPITALHQVLVPQFIASLPSLTGTVVELNVLHSEYARKKDGVPLLDEATGQPLMGKRQKVYYNKLVQKGTGGGPAVNANFPTDFQPNTATADDDDIPF